MMYDHYTGGSLVGIMHHQQHHSQHQQQQQQQHLQQKQQQQHHHHHHHHQLQQHQQHHDHQHQQQHQQHLQDLHLQHPDLHHHQHQQHQQHPQSQQQQQQQEQQQHQFMAETAQWLAEDSQDEFVPKVVHRRAKRIIPDTEKDDKYWEKRKRNNQAAKRSRENKRVLENDIRQKVTCLEENNAMLRKELALMKSRFGLAPDQNIMTPEERAQCLQEIKANMEATAARRRKESSGSGDDVSSTSPSVYPVTLHVGGGGGGSGPSTAATSTSSVDEVDKKGGDESDDSSSPKMEEGSSSAGGAGALGADVGGVGYGPSAYGPFNPSPSWGPIGAAGMNSFPGGATATPGHVFSQALSGSSTKLPPISNAFQEKGGGAGGFGRFVGGVGGLGAYARPPYDYFSQYSPQMLYGTGDAAGLSGGAAPADLSTNRNKRQEEAASARGASSGGANTRAGGMGVPTKTENLGHTMIPSPGGGNTGGMLLDDMAAMASSLAHSNVGRSSGGGQDSQMVVRGLTVPTRLNTPGASGGGAGGVAGGGVSHGLAAEAAALAASTQGIKGPEEEHLKRENDALKMAVRTLTAQMEHMKDQVYKD